MLDPNRSRIQEIGRLAALTSHSIGGADAVLSVEEIPQWNLLRAIDCARTPQWPYSGTLEGRAHSALCKRHGETKSKLAIRVPPEVLRRDLTAGGSGAYLVSGAVIPSFYGALHARSVIFRLGAQLLPGLQGNVALAKLTSEPNATWQSTESTTVVESTPGAGFVALSPRTVGAYVELSDLSTKQVGAAGQQLVLADMAAKLAAALDAAALAGSGLEGEPTGLAYTAGIGSTSGTSLGYAGVLDPQETVATAKGLVNVETAAYVTTPAVAKLMAQRTRFSNQDTPIWDGSVSDGTMAGARAMSTTNCPASTVIFGDWSQLVVGMWDELVIEVNPFANFRAGIIGLRGLLSCDIAVRWRESFHVIRDIT